MPPDLSSRNILVLGAETPNGREIVSALATAGAHVAAVSARTDTESALAVQRLVRRVSTGGGSAEAKVIDATNEMAVRIVVRQVGKTLERLHALVYVGGLAYGDSDALALAVRFGAKEMARSGSGVVLIIGTDKPVDAPQGTLVMRLGTGGAVKPEQVALTLDAILNNR